jgi:outer membrane biogenesis lipoprotein LolB
MFTKPTPSPQQASLKQTGHWQGRLSLRVLQPTPEQFSASFELNGSADHGELSLYSPLGTTLAVARWTPQNAQLLQGDKVQDFASMEALTQQLTGAALPLPALLAWLDVDGPANRRRRDGTAARASAGDQAADHREYPHRRNRFRRHADFVG